MKPKKDTQYYETTSQCTTCQIWWQRTVGKGKIAAKSFASKVIAGSPNSQRMPTVKLPS
jgi:hypothetical protein